MQNIFTSRRRIGLAMILAILVLFFAVNILASTLFRNARIDLTEGQLFTLSDGTINILNSIDEPVKLKVYYSEADSTDIQQVHTTAERVKDMLAEFAKHAHGNLQVVIVPVERYTESEDEASAEGLTGAQTANGDIIYFGLVATNSVDGREIVPFFPLDREEFLEYDLISIIYRLNRIDLPVLGLLASLPLDTGPGGMQAAMQGNAQPYVIYEQLLGSFEVEHIDASSGVIPDGIEVLMIAHPEPLSSAMQYAIDQFVMRGGRILALLDPVSEMSLASMPQMMQPGEPQATNERSVLALGRLLTSWGVEIRPDVVVTDGALGYYVPQSNYPPILTWPRLDESVINRDDLVTAQLTDMQFASVGSIEAIEGATTTLIPLMSSSVLASTLPWQDVKFRKPFEEVLQEFTPDDHEYVLAARIQGPVDSAFPNGAPEDAALSGDEGAPPHITHADAANIILVADADFLDDRFWVQHQSFLGERLMQPTADNGAFVVGAIENLMGSNDLISLRTRAGSLRPFTRVQEIQRRAEEEFLPKQEELEQKLTEIANRVDELRGTALSDDGTILVTPEQRAELSSLLAEHEEVRKEQRDIQFNLRHDIDLLGNRVRFINVALMPLLVAAFALALAFHQRRRRNARKMEGAGQ